MNRVLLLLLGYVVVSCQSPTPITKTEEPKYLRWVGDIEFDESLGDDSTFSFCNEDFIYQYFNFMKGLEYEGERVALYGAFEKSYMPILKDSESGLIRIRFIVNCQGETGRFRLIEMDENYQEKVFDSKITEQLMSIAKSLDGWKALTSPKGPSDYYQYLIFKMEGGKIKEILP
jgi:hypothetical protein